MDLKSINDAETDQRRIAARARRAKAILESDIVQKAFKEIEDQLVGVLKDSALEQSVEREDAYRCIRLLKRFKDGFEKHLRDGTMAEHRIADLKAQRKTLMQRMRLA